MTNEMSKWELIIFVALLVNFTLDAIQSEFIADIVAKIGGL